MADPISSMEKGIRNVPLATLDILIESISQYKSNQYEVVFALINECINSYLQANIDSEVKFSFPYRNLPKEKRIFVGLCLIRIIGKNREFFDYDVSVRIEIIKFIDSVFENIIYKNDKAFQGKLQSHEKLDKLQFYINDLEQRTFANIKSSSLENIETYKQNYFAKLFSGKGKLFFKHFITPDIYQPSTLQEVFVSIEKYITAESVIKLREYEKCISKLNTVINTIKAGKYSTFYAKKILVEPFECLLELLRLDLDKSPFVKPAKLKLLAIPKKYPFSEVGLKFRVGLRLENLGDGLPQNIIVRIVHHNSSIEFERKEFELLSFDTRTFSVEFHAQVKRVIEQNKVKVSVEWYNYDNSKAEISEEILLQGQSKSIDWDELTQSEPYSLEYIDEENKLFGRRSIIDRLYAGVKSHSVSSAYIYGQKRVGKTSVAKVLQSRIDRYLNKNFLTIYLEVGDFQTISTDVAQTINNLSERICKKIKRFDRKLDNLSPPQFDGSLSAVSTFLDDISHFYPDLRVLIILDEFDELNPKLYDRTEVGNSFFLSIRAISNKRNYGFILVGGEKMEIIVSNQGEQINKFSSIRVDSFDKESDYPSFIDLVRSPSTEIEYTDESIEMLYNYTAGNPFFAKIICKKIFERVILSKDTHVTRYEMQKSIDLALREEGPNSFMHFWEDGIRVEGIEEEEISMMRRKVLLGVADTINKSGRGDMDLVLQQLDLLGLNIVVARKTINEFIDRRIIVKLDNQLRFRVKYFEDWLVKYGVERIITTFSNDAQVEERQRREAAALIEASELSELVRSWGSYQGKEVTTDKVKEWLIQFGSNSNQRLVFTLLKELKFYDDNLIFESMGNIYKRVSRYSLQNMTKVLEGQSGSDLEKNIRNNTFISYLDGVGKSGAEYARLFAEENRIFIKNIIDKAKLGAVLSNVDSQTNLVFVDDFLGTGKTIETYFLSLFEEFPSLFTNQYIQIYIGVVAGFSEAKDEVINKLVKTGIKNLRILIGNPLSKKDKCFDDESDVFRSNSDRIAAKNLCYNLGLQVERKAPLGFGDCQAIVAFSRTCPNNSLPILWKSTKEWIPLFERK